MKKKSKIKFSKYQKDVFKALPAFLSDFNSNLMVINACAGSGKTFTLLELIVLIKEYNRRFKVQVAAYNDHIATEFKERIAAKQVQGVGVQTSHSYSYYNVLLPFIELENAKREKKRNKGKIDRSTEHINSSMLPNKAFGFKIYDYDIPIISNGYILSDTIDKIRTLGIVDTSSKGLKKALSGKLGEIFPNLISRIESIGGYKVVSDVLKVLDYDLDNIDFDDMLRLPVIHNMYNDIPESVPDVLIIDEGQDLNDLQLESLRCMLEVNPNLKIIIVLDPYQSIYSFRGAIQTYDKLLKLFSSKSPWLKTTSVKPEVYNHRLGLTYRSKQNIVNYIVDTTGIDFEAKNKGGDVYLHAAYKKKDPYCINTILKNHEIDMILSPKNSHLVAIAVRLWDKGIKANFKRSKLLNKIIKILQDNIDSEIDLLLEKLYTKKKTKSNNPDALEEKDLVTSMILIIDHYEFETVLDAIQGLTKLIKQDSNKGISLYTVHGSKGLEAENVLLINDFFGNKEYPEEELHLKYVGMTRAIDTLHIVDPHFCRMEANHDPANKLKKSDYANCEGLKNE